MPSTRAPGATTRTAPSGSPGGRQAWADTLKVALVAGVIVAHATMAWTGLETWVFDEPTVREPLLDLLLLLELVGALIGMPLFFLVAGLFTPPALRRKGSRRFLTDRLVRLGVPLVFFCVVLSPIVEWADPDTAGWDRGFLAFAVHTWWPPVPGPAWFLAVLLLFSGGYVALRAVRPARAHPAPLRARTLVAAGLCVAVPSYLIRIVVPLGEERWHLAVAQSPAWVVGFALGVLAAERHWFGSVPPRLDRRIAQVAWGAVGTCVLVVATAAATGIDIDRFGGGGGALSAIIAVLEATLVVAMSLWIVATFRRRVHGQGRLMSAAGRAAFAAFLVHQVVLVWLVLASHQVGWPPEAEYLLVATVGVVMSFAVAAALVRVPGVRRIV